MVSNLELELCLNMQVLDYGVLALVKEANCIDVDPILGEISATIQFDWRRQEMRIEQGGTKDRQAQPLPQDAHCSLEKSRCFIDTFFSPVQQVSYHLVSNVVIRLQYECYSSRVYC